MGIVINVVGVLLVTRIIGPREFGLFAGGAGLVTFLYTFGTWGLDVYLLRKPEEPLAEEFDQAFTLLLLLSTVLALGIVAGRSTIAGFLRMPEEARLLPVLALAIPLNLLAAPAVVRLDRALNFKQVATNELISQFAYYVIAVPLAFRGAGAWAPVMGFLTQQVSLLTLAYWTTRTRPGFHWDRGLIGGMLDYGLSYSGSIWIYQLRTLVNPVIVGRFAGAEAVGFVAVGIRIARLLSFAKNATWRLAMPALAKLGADASRLCGAVTEGMRFQAVAVGYPLAIFAAFSPDLIPLAFGQHWAPAVAIFPFVALSYLTNSMFNLHSSVLYMLGKNWSVAWFHLVHIALFAGSAALLVPKMGFIGYGWAEVACLPSYAVLHTFMRQTVGTPSYWAPAAWYAAALSAILVTQWSNPFRYLGLFVLFVPLLSRPERSILSGYIQLLFPKTGSQPGVEA